MRAEIIAVNVQGLENLTGVLQASISPVALISGVGLLILSQTNRLSHVMDRLRQLMERRKASEPDVRLEKQIAVPHSRAGTLKGAVTAAVTCVLLASALVLLLFTLAVFDMHMELLNIALFALSMLSLIVSLVLFIFDLDQSLHAVEEELSR